MILKIKMIITSIAVLIDNENKIETNNIFLCYCLVIEYIKFKLI